MHQSLTCRHVAFDALNKRTTVSRQHGLASRHRTQSIDARRRQCATAATSNDSDAVVAAVTRRCRPPPPPGIDPDLWEVLDVCTDEDLTHVYHALQSTSWFSPVLKSLLSEREPASLQLRGRDDIIRRIDHRLRFLAADSAATLRGRWPTYREVLLKIWEVMKVNCPSTLATSDLETEILLHVLRQSHGLSDLLSTDRAASKFATTADTRDDGGGEMQSFDWRLQQSWRLKRLLAPLWLGKEEWRSTSAAVGGAIGVAGAKKVVMTSLTREVLRNNAAFATHFRTLCTALSRSSASAALAETMAVQAAQKSLTASAARYGMVRSVLGLLGPLMTVWLGVDLALKAVGTDYARIIRAVCLLAQARLLNDAAASVHAHATDVPPPTAADA